jgi:hypothetical protein
VPSNLPRDRERDITSVQPLEADEMNYPAATKRLERITKHSWTKKSECSERPLQRVPLAPAVTVQAVLEVQRIVVAFFVSNGVKLLGKERQRNEEANAQRYS